jgi:CubicO group peptidase (beta-lactamase class C family)
MNTNIRHKKLVTSILFFSFFLQVSCAQKSTSKSTNNIKADKIEEIVGLYNHYDGFNGSILVAHEGELIYKKGFGLANMEWEVPNSVSTKYRIASITKPFTAILIMQMVSKNILELNVPISTYLPNYPKESGNKITIHHLLTHSSGIQKDSESSRPINRFPDRVQIAQLVSDFSNLPLEFEPGEKFTYSNSGYMLLAHIIETVSGKSYETMLQENIFNVVGMKNSGTDKHRPIIKQRAQGYFKAFGDYYNSNYIDMSTTSGVGNIYTTVEDLYLFDQAFFDGKILKKKYVDLMLTKHFIDGNGFYGYGWELSLKPIGNTSETINSIGHNGVIDGFCATFTRIPSSNSTIIILNNTQRAFLNAITTAVTGILNNTTYDFPLKPLAQFMTEAIKKEGIEKGVLFYKEHKDMADYYVSEEELIVAGYKYLHSGNLEYAVQVFKLSTEVFPNNDNPYDSYAEALMTLGKNEEAIKNYKKSLEINPNNNNAKEKLKELEKK